MTLDNDGFARLVIVILGGIVVIDAAWQWMKRKQR